MEFDALPVELLVKISSYLAQHSLIMAAEGSRRWNQVALDPELWTEFKMDSTVEAEAIALILGRPTKLRKLDIAGRVAKVGDIAPVLPHFKELKELAIDMDTLASDIMLTTLGRCKSLTTLVITGDPAHYEDDVAFLKTLSFLKSVVVSGKVDVSYYAIRKIYSCCHLLASLNQNAFLYGEDFHAYLKNLRYLRRLSLTKVYTTVLLLLSNSCPNLECLKILALSSYMKPRAKIFDKFLKLKRLTVSRIPVF